MKDMLVVRYLYCNAYTNIGQILGISIYIKAGMMDNVPFGRRAILYNGSADLNAIIQEEMSGIYIKRVQAEKTGEMLVMGKI